MPFADSTAMAEATLRLLTDVELRTETRRKAYQYAKPMFWPNVGQLYLDFFGQVVAESRKESTHTLRRSSPQRGESLREELLQKGM